MKAIKGNIEIFAQNYKGHPKIFELRKKLDGKKEALEGPDILNVVLRKIQNSRSAKEVIEVLEEQKKLKSEDYEGQLQGKRRQLMEEYLADLQNARAGMYRTSDLEKVHNIAVKYKRKFKCSEKLLKDLDNYKTIRHSSIIRSTARQKIARLFYSKVNGAKNLCGLDKIAKEISKLQRAYPGFEVNELDIEAKEKRRQFMEEDSAVLQNAKAKIDRNWAVDDVGHIIAECKNKLKCNDVLLRDFEMYGNTRLREIANANLHYKTIEEDVKEVKDLNALSLIKAGINGFKQK